MSEIEKPKVAFLGPEGSYTHQATLTTFPLTNHTLTPQRTIEDVFAAVQSGTAHRGVVPFENSTNGSVVATLDLLADQAKKYSALLVCDEAYVAVSHCLLSVSAAVPLSAIKKVYSHPQAWGQCKTFLQEELKHAEKLDVSSTSRAAQMVAEAQDESVAAISSAAASSLFHVPVLREAINDVRGNQTRFLVLRHRDAGPLPTSTSTSTVRPPPSTTAAPVLEQTTGRDEDFKTLLLFTLPHSPSNPSPGALAHCLAVFARHNLDLTSINTRPSGVANWAYVFFIEFRGRKEDDAAGDEAGPVNKAFKELEGLCEWYRWLGSWENRLPEA